MFVGVVLLLWFTLKLEGEDGNWKMSEKEKLGFDITARNGIRVDTTTPVLYVHCLDEIKESILDHITWNLIM